MNCSICTAPFMPKHANQKTCLDPICIAEQKRQDRIARMERKTIRAKREALKSKAEYMREAQAEFNRYIRLRDDKEPCISCGRFHQGQYHAGHYRTTKSAPELRFEPLNVWKQCMPCNAHLSGNIIEYRKNLIQKIGQEKVEWLEGPHAPKHYTIDDLKQIKLQYRNLCKSIK